MIKVTREDSRVFTVVIKQTDSRRQYTVTLDDDYHQHLTAGKRAKEEFIQASFEFLLKREPKESILPQFNLKVINRYFPEFEREIHRQLKGKEHG
jgi:hypothetical protein